MKISSISAEEQAYRYIKNRIINKELHPMEQIVEMDIANQSGISRTSVRAAIRRLGYEGLATIRKNKGAFVVNPSKREMCDIFSCKCLLETEAIRLACHRITKDELGKIEQLLYNEPQTFYEKDFNAFLALNFQYHMIIAHASQNACYEKFIDELMTRSNVFLIFYDDFMRTSFDESEAHKEHCSIFEALCQGDEHRCMEEMRRHSDTTFETLSVCSDTKTC